MWRVCIWIIYACLLSSSGWAENAYRFRVYLKDKGESGFSIEHPELFLSPDAIDRRQRQNIPITETDLPIAACYIDQLCAEGFKIVTQSRWLATVVVETTDSVQISRLQKFPFIDSVKWVWRGNPALPASERAKERLVAHETVLPVPYGYAEKQIKMLNGAKLHARGYRGKGMRVAVIDAGFMNVDQIAAFDSLQLIGTHNVVYPRETVYSWDEHGTKVLSCLAANLPGVMVGTAPEASYLLIKSEDSESEYPVEEDYWAAAVEYADSMGVDVVTSSLGYYAFEAPELNYSVEALDGRTAQISRAAAIAAEKGLLVFSSAGNEGAGSWRHITFPADGIGIFTVGSVDARRRVSTFSSVGWSSDGRVKPDAVALGTSSCVIGSDGKQQEASGTSFATPILAGMGVCLWQALPWLDNQALIHLIHRVSSRAKHADVHMGYGIPDIYKAYKIEHKHALKQHIEQ